MTRPRLLDRLRGGRGRCGKIITLPRDELTQAVPPAFTEYVGTFLLAAVRERAA
jgi:hypothetical protein